MPPSDPPFAAALARALAGRERRVLGHAGRTAAAVLVPLFLMNGEAHALYTRRSERLPTHRGQVAFPGGRHHPAEDSSLEATALREAHEEIGLVPTDVRVLGALDDIDTVGSGFVITPFVGLTPWPYAWQACPAEVDVIFTVALERLRAPGATRREVWSFRGRRIPIDTFPVDGHVIWGATERITRNLLDVVGKLDDEETT